MAIGGTAGAWLILTRGNGEWFAKVLLAVVILALPGLLGIYAVLSALRSRVRLYADRIEVRGLGRTHVLARDEISGSRLDARTLEFVLMPRDSGRRAVKINSMIKFDESFFEWLSDVPDLDEREVQQAESEIASDVRLGATAEARLSELEKWTRFARPVNIVAGVVGLWGLLYPRPYPLVIAILIFLPVVALGLVARSKGILRFDQYKNDPHPHVAGAIIFPPMTLALRSVVDFSILSSTHALWLTIGVAAVVWFATTKADSTLTSRRIGSFAIAAFMLAYGYGAGLQTNVLLDRSAWTSYTATIAEKHVSRGRGTSYKLRLKPWGPKKDGSTVTVAANLFNVLEPGDFVILGVRQGFLGVPWYGVQSYRRRYP